jgi:hypothetical protein
MMHRAIVLLFWIVPMWAQHPLESYSVTVELRLPPDQTNLQLRGELASTSAITPNAGVWMSGGRMQFDNVPAGVYRLDILNARGTILKTLMVPSRPGSDPVVVDLIPTPESGPSGPVSIHQLLHTAPANAVRLLVQSREFTGAPAVALLRRALEEDPQFFEAHVSLGVELLRLKDGSGAAQQFEAAFQERPDSAAAATDLALANVAMQRPEDAERYARRALAIDSTLHEAQFVLAEALILKGRLSEAETYLRRAAIKLPQANALLAWVVRNVTAQKVSGNLPVEKR